MNGAHLLLAAALALLALLAVLAVLHARDRRMAARAAAPLWDPEVDAFLRSLEALRAAIQRETGREISELVLRGGRWHARTSRGEELVSDLLRRGRHNYLGGAQP